jgi:hypothetical protein
MTAPDAPRWLRLGPVLGLAVIGVGCVVTSPPSYASRAFPTPGSAESRAAHAACEGQVDEATRRKADGHVAWNAVEGNYALAFRSRREWTSEEAAARQRLEAVVGECMAKQGWIRCIWERDRSKAVMGLEGEGWVCHRVRLDDPQS